MRLQEGLKLLEERNTSMMFLLSLDVALHLGQHRLTHRERAVSLLPFEARGVLECSRDPAGRVRLKFANELRDRLVLPKLRQDVNVVGSSVGDHGDSTFAANGATKIFMNPRTDCGRQPRFAALRREDDVIQQIAMGGTHAAAGFRRPCQGLVCLDYIRSSAALHSGL